MRTWSYLAIVGALLGCSSKSIDAGTNDAAVVEADGATLLASGIVSPPVRLVSDGTTIFWTDMSGNLSSMPASGGAARVVLTKLFDTFLSVDDENIYIQRADGLYRVPKAGGTPTLITDPGSNSVRSGFATILGGNAYWLDQPGIASVQSNGQLESSMVVKSAPLKGGPISSIAQSEVPSGTAGSGIAVTSSAVFLETFVETALETDEFPLMSFPTSTGTSDGGVLQTVSGVTQDCLNLISDSDAVYCYVPNGPIIRIASDGSTTSLGVSQQLDQTAGNPSLLAVDGTNIYWIATTTSGLIMRTRKTGGPSAEPAVIVTDHKTPIAVAVDAAFVYWANAAGEIQRLPK